MNKLRTFLQSIHILVILTFCVIITTSMFFAFFIVGDFNKILTTGGITVFSLVFGAIFGCATTLIIQMSLYSNIFWIAAKTFNENLDKIDTLDELESLVKFEYKILWGLADTERHQFELERLDTIIKTMRKYLK